MKKTLTTILVLGAVALLMTRLPKLVAAALLHGTGTVVRDQKAWMPVTPEEQQ